ncbi:MAG: hypothetical protein QOC94_3692 [Actinoplanes sp.]|nr:hypothetical protein [Actinoplanes sp.]
MKAASWRSPCWCAAAAHPDQAPAKAADAIAGIHSAAVGDRVRALGDPRPLPRHRWLIGPLLAGAGCLLAIGVATAEFVELARAWL